jgi:hypothetical protein
VATSNSYKLSTSKLAKQNKLKTTDFLDLLTEKGYLSFINEADALTYTGIERGR